MIISCSIADFKILYLRNRIVSFVWPNQIMAANDQRSNTDFKMFIDSHVANECPLTTINCDFHHVGCAVKLPRQDMPEHVNSSLSAHMSLLATSHAKLMLENDRQLKSFETNVAALQTKVATL